MMLGMSDSDMSAAVTTLSPELGLVALVVVFVARQLVPLLAIFLPEKLAARAERVLRIQRGRPDSEPEADPERSQDDP
jgi:hypothetical protein